MSRSADGKQIQFVQPRRVIIVDEHQIRTSTAAEDILSRVSEHVNAGAKASTGSSARLHRGGAR